jgi:hypothetical protein
MSEALPTIWFVLIAVLWAGYLFLEGFDLGVGMLMKLVYRTDSQRRVLLNTVGPVWDGNEVWLITAIGAMFAAFPLWYASLLSSLYLPFLAVLLGLIFRAVAFEWRGKVDSAAWRNRWDWAIALGSLTAAAGIGAALALTTTGLPINANGDREGGPFAWFSGYALLGSAAVVLFCLVHAAAFLALKTDGGVRHRALRVMRRLLPVALLPMLAWAIVVQVRGGTLLTAAALSLPPAAPSPPCARPPEPRRTGLRGAGVRHGTGPWARSSPPPFPWCFPRPSIRCSPDGRHRVVLPYTLTVMSVVPPSGCPDPGLPGLDLLGVPPPDLRAQHPRGPRRDPAVSTPGVRTGTERPRRKPSEGPAGPVGSAPAVYLLGALAAAKAAGLVLVAQALASGLAALADGRWSRECSCSRALPASRCAPLPPGARTSPPRGSLSA